MPAIKFSANTGFLWPELPFLDRVRQAARAGFDAVEFHDEAQSADPVALKEVLAEAAIPVLGINIRRGNTGGSAAIPSLVSQARQDIEKAAQIADAIGGTGIHVMAGITEDPHARKVYVENLRFALDHSPRTILIEPVCHEQVPGYFLRTIDQAASVLAEIDHPRLKIMFDCYHIHRESGNVLDHFRRHAQHIGHVQIAAAEHRAEPRMGELDYTMLLPAFQKAGYKGWFGCEYRPKRSTDEGLDWRNAFQ